MPARLKREQFGKKSVRRNPLVADLMARAGYIERMGTGIKKMRDLVKAEGLPPIKFEFDNFTTVTFYRKPLSGGYFIEPSKKTDKIFISFNLTKERLSRVLKILTFIEKGKFSTVDFSKSKRINSRTIERDIKFLRDKKLITFKGHSKSGKYQITAKYKKLKKSIK